MQAQNIAKEVTLQTRKTVFQNRNHQKNKKLRIMFCLNPRCLKQCWQKLKRTDSAGKTKSFLFLKKTKINKVKKTATETPKMHMDSFFASDMFLMSKDHFYWFLIRSVLVEVKRLRRAFYVFTQLTREPETRVMKKKDQTL